jgi:hypothetical protein
MLNAVFTAVTLMGSREAAKIPSCIVDIFVRFSAEYYNIVANTGWNLLLSGIGRYNPQGTGRLSIARPTFL